MTKETGKGVFPFPLYPFHSNFLLNDYYPKALLLLLAGIIFSCNRIDNTFYLPIDAENRKEVTGVKLTEIGSFGMQRDSRPGIPAHLHTGIDIIRPNSDYRENPVFPAFPGRVISLRGDGPYAQIIIEHIWKDDQLFWTVYEHIAGIRTSLGARVKPDFAIARFMNIDELNRYGWQFDHLHFEIMKMPPVQAEPSEELPDRFYYSHWQSCRDSIELHIKYFDPLAVFADQRLTEFNPYPN